MTMFANTIDNKTTTTDPNGNEIVDLTSSIFSNGVQITSYTLKRVPNDYIMRPDLVSLAEYGSTDKTEYIMMFNQVGNPFTLEKDDVLLIPDVMEADSLVSSVSSTDSAGNNTTSDASIQEILVQNYYKHSGRHNNVDMTSYDDFENSSVPSGTTTATTTATDSSTGSLPYMLDSDTGSSMVIRNNRIYFNNTNDAGLAATEVNTSTIDSAITSILDSSASSSCAYNGTSLSSFIKALNDSSN